MGRAAASFLGMWVAMMLPSLVPMLLRSLVARLEEEPHMNPNTGTTEFSLRDLDGYCVTINALSAA